MRRGARPVALIIAYAAEPSQLLGSATFTSAHASAYEIMNIYAIRMARVFMIATSTLALRTGFIARWIALLGYAVALLLLCAATAGSGERDFHL